MKLVIDKNSNFTHKGGASRPTPETTRPKSPTGQMAHTPLPWHTDPGMADDPRFYIKSLNHVVVAILDSHSSIRDEANAEYIVTACNSFPALVEVLESIRREAELCRNHGIKLQFVTFCEGKALQALAKAGSGQSVAEK